MYKEHYSLMAPGKYNENYVKSMKEFMNIKYCPMINWKTSNLNFLLLCWGDRKKKPLLYSISHDS